LDNTYCYKYRQTPVSTDSISTVSVICGQLRPPKNLENWRNKWFIIFKTCTKQEQTITWWNPATQTCPVLEARTDRNVVKSSNLNVPSTWLIFFCPHTHASPQTFHHSASTIFTVRISCCVYRSVYCSESNKKNGEVSEYPQLAKIFFIK
jgi:hypothetical protein